jgi:hypothetical protein
MARNYLFWIGLFLSSCAQVVPLSGGNKDIVAPHVLDQNPAQGSTNTNCSSITLEFDEYIKLQDPANTVSMSPSVGDLTCTQNKRKVTISWNGTLAENTTYILQLNGTVRDVNEGNDSIMQLVFSTGAQIDSASTAGIVIDAFTNEAVQGATVGLYLPGSDPFKTAPQYAARTNSKGEYRFNYLKNQPYHLFAFLDRNKNQEVDPDETIAFNQDPITVTDTLQQDLRMYLPDNTSKKTRVQPILPGIMAVSGYHIADQNIRINGMELKPAKTITTDSVLVKLPELIESLTQVIVGKDTLQRNIQPKERLKPAAIRMSSKNILATRDSLVFSMNLIANNLDADKIQLLTSKNEPLAFNTQIKGDQLIIYPSTPASGALRIHFDRNALSDGISMTDSCTFAVQYLAKNELATLELDASVLTGAYVIELLEGQKVIATRIKKSEENKVTFEGLVPGNYSLRCISDTNGNAKWDSGSYPDTQAENVLRFPIRQKLKGNWIVEEVLKIE